MNHIRKYFKKIPSAKALIFILRSVKNKYSLIKRTKLLYGFFSDYFKYKKINNNKNIKFSVKDAYPRIYDKTIITPIDPVYFYQDAWCARKIIENTPVHHCDVGSKAEMVGIISQFIPTTMIDIRPLEIKLHGLSFLKGSILSLPFKDGEIASLSSICVIEHIGLGRYGDELDSFGTEKATKELARVLSPNGNLYISVPVDIENKVYFNAHRAFTRDYVLELFKSLKLIEEKYIYGNNLVDEYSQSNGFGTGLYHFKKT